MDGVCPVVGIPSRTTCRDCPVWVLVGAKKSPRFPARAAWRSTFSSGVRPPCRLAVRKPSGGRQLKHEAGQVSAPLRLVAPQIDITLRLSADLPVSLPVLRSNHQWGPLAFGLPAWALRLAWVPWVLWASLPVAACWVDLPFSILLTLSMLFLWVASVTRSIHGR